MSLQCDALCSWRPSGQQSLSYKSDSELGLSLIDRFTYQTLAFFEDIDIKSTMTLADLFNTYRCALRSLTKDLAQLLGPDRGDDVRGTTEYP